MLLSACSQVKETLTAAGAELDEFFGVEAGNVDGAAPDRVESAPAAPSPAGTAPLAAGEPAYQSGLARQRAGDHAGAVELFRTAAEQGHGGAAYELGLAYSKGEGVGQDLDAAALWLNRAAERGDARAQYLAGINYSTGTGVPRDLARAAEYWGDAAVQGHARAQYLLAQAFADGQGVRKDVAWAAMWYGKAARQAHVEAQFSYGVLLATGRGLPEDTVGGYGWLLLASQNGHGQAEEVRRALAAKLSDDERRDGEAKAKAFRALPQQSFIDPPAITFVQFRLSDLGYAPGPIDGMMGPQTRSAVITYQRRRGLTADGVIGPRLLGSLLADAPNTG